MYKSVRVHALFLHVVILLNQAIVNCLACFVELI
jgi:hypothetical protein